MLVQPDSWPEFRAYTFGAFRLERLVTNCEQAGRLPAYAPVSRDAWQGRGSGRRLLRFLLCRGATRRAHREVILHALWPGDGREERVSNGSASLNAAMHSLATALPPRAGKEPLLTLEREEHSYFYTLAGPERLWVDLDEFERLMQLAGRVSQKGEDSLPLLEQARVLSCGEFLPEDRYSSWMQERRREVEAAQHQCTHRLALLYTERAQEEQAEALLIRVLAHNPCDEDALDRLMSTLARQGRNHEALHFYRRSARVIQEGEKHKISKRLRDFAEQLRTNPLLLLRSAPPLLRYEEPSPDQPALSGLILVETTPGTETHQGVLVPEFLQGIEANRPDLFLGALSTYVLDLVTRWRYREEPFGQFQARLAKEIRRIQFMEPRSSHSEQAILNWKGSRRQALASLALLPASLLFQVHQEPTTVLVVEEVLPRSAAALAACTQLVNGNDFALAEHALAYVLPHLQELAKQPSAYQKDAATLVTQTYHIQGIIDMNRNELSQREAHLKQAIIYARIIENPYLLAYTLVLQANTYGASQSPTRMLQMAREGQLYLDKVSPLLGSRISLALADAYALCGQASEAEEYLARAREQFLATPSGDEHVSAGLSGLTTVHSFPRMEGQIYLDLERYREAWNALERVEQVQSDVVLPERARVETLNLQAEAALGMRDLERFCVYIKAGRDGALALGSEKGYQQAFEVYKQGRRFWASEKRVRNLGELFVR
jgi:DNA-binding SARP family transcriptional activator/tetratricopeptide (TPR) repeat protein